MEPKFRSNMDEVVIDLEQVQEPGDIPKSKKEHNITTLIAIPMVHQLLLTYHFMFNTSISRKLFDFAAAISFLI